MSQQTLSFLVTERDGSQRVENINGAFLTSNSNGSFRINRSLVSRLIRGLKNWVIGRTELPMYVSDKNNQHRSVPGTAAPRNHLGQFEKLNRK